jgi:hypothetical protein
MSNAREADYWRALERVAVVDEANRRLSAELAAMTRRNGELRRALEQYANDSHWTYSPPDRMGFAESWTWDGDWLPEIGDNPIKLARQALEADDAAS